MRLLSIGDQMLEQIGGILVQLVLTFLVVKLYTDSRNKKPVENKVQWKDASVVIEKLETRLGQLQDRDADSQEKIWNLEDQNRVLKLHIAELKRDRDARSIPFTVKGGDED